MTSAYNSQMKVFDRLLNVNLCDKNGNTSLITAAVNGYLERLIHLVDAGADVNLSSFTKYEHTALIKAARLGHKTCLEFSLKSEAEVEKTDLEGMTALMHSVFKGRHDCTDILIKAGADVNCKDITGTSTLMHAVFNKNFNDVALLLRAGADMNAINKDGYTSLYFAAWKGFLECVTLLITHGADVNKICCGIQTALMMASFQGHLDCVKILVQSGANVNVQSKYRDNALTLTSVKRHLRCMKFLLKSGSQLRNLEYFPFLRFLPSPSTDKLIELLHAAGVKTLLREKPSGISLKDLCRMRIRTLLLRNHSDMNLFYTVPQVGLPSSLECYLLFHVTLDDDNDVKDNSDYCEVQQSKHH